MKSLLTSLCQREENYPSLAKRGQGRFCGACQINFETLKNYNLILPVIWQIFNELLVKGILISLKI
jgi:hypothetical protein